MPILFTPRKVSPCTWRKGGFLRKYVSEERQYFAALSGGYCRHYLNGQYQRLSCKLKNTLFFQELFRHSRNTELWYTQISYFSWIADFACRALFHELISTQSALSMLSNISYGKIMKAFAFSVIWVLSTGRRCLSVCVSWKNDSLSPKYARFHKAHCSFLKWVLQECIVISLESTYKLWP